MGVIFDSDKTVIVFIFKSDLNIYIIIVFMNNLNICLPKKDIRNLI